MADNVRGIQRRPSPTPSRQPDPDSFINKAKASDTELDPYADLLDALAPLETQGYELKPKTFNLRLPPDLHAKLEAISEKTGRSMHEILMKLVVPGIEKAYDRFGH